VHPMPHAVSEAHMRARVDELRRQAVIQPRRRRAGKPRLHTMRTTTGWFLVSLGLRLAAPPTAVAR
jgi:hypothetical protein